MKYFTTLLVASAALTSAQVVYNETTGTFACPAYAPNGNFCAGNSLEGNIIIRCTNGVGRPGNCNDNLAGRPPLGLRFSPCFQTKPTAGDAACTKNCIVYPENGNATFTLPGCSPSVTSTTIIGTSPPITVLPPAHTTIIDPSFTPSGRPPVHTSYPNVTTIIVDPSRPVTTHVPSGTGIIHPPAANGTTLNPTRTPVGPSTSVRPTTPPQFTGAADKTSVSAFAGVLAFAALFML